jgi:hypothetical protein
MKKLLIAVAGLAMVAAPLAASAQSYGRAGGGWNSGRASGGQASYNRGNDRRAYGGNDAAAAALTGGVIGLLLGSALSHSNQYGYPQSYGYARSYGYGEGRYGSGGSYGYAQPYGYGASYGRQTRDYDDAYGRAGYRQAYR